MLSRLLKIAAAALAACVFAGIGAASWTALSRSGLLNYVARPLSWDTYGYIVLGAFLYGLTFIVLLSPLVGLGILVRRLFRR